MVPERANVARTRHHWPGRENRPAAERAADRRVCRKGWCAWRGSNPQPSAPEADALSNWATGAWCRKTGAESSRWPTGTQAVFARTRGGLARRGGIPPRRRRPCGPARRTDCRLFVFSNLRIRSKSASSPFLKFEKISELRAAVAAHPHRDRRASVLGSRSRRSTKGATDGLEHTRGSTPGGRAPAQGMPSLAELGTGFATRIAPAVSAV